MPHATMSDADRARKLRTRYQMWVISMPAAVAALSFGGICAWECTAGPWLTFLVAPAVALVVWLISVPVFLRWSSAIPEEADTLRTYFKWSLLWAPPLAAVATTALLGTAATVIGAVMSIFL
jgi:hypothetical protein